MELMAEYITKEAAIEAFENGEADVIEDYGDGADFGFGLKNIKSTINTIPAADVAPVVRCIKCKYLMANVVDDPVCGHPYGMRRIFRDSYCSYGELQTNAKGDRPWRRE